MAEKNETKEIKKKPKKEQGEKRRFRRIRETWSELKKVTWPSFGTVMKNLGVVLVIMAIFVVLLLAFDLILRFGVFDWLTGKNNTAEIFTQSFRGGLSQIKLIFSRSL